MKIAIITSRYPKENQPYNHMFVHVRALYFKSQGVDVTILVPAKEKSIYNYQGIDVIEDVSSEIANVLGKYDLLYLHLLNQYPLKNGGFSIYNAILKNKYPVAIYIHGTDVLKYPEYLYDFTWSIKGIVKYLYINTWNHFWMKRFLRQISLSNRYLIMTPSLWMKNHTEKILAIKFDKFYAVPNGVDTELFDVPFNYQNRHKIITIRPLSDVKYGVDMSIELMRFLPDIFTLDIYGKGFLKYKYEQLIKKYNLENRVRIIDDFIERKDLPTLFSNYGIFSAFTLFDSQGVIMCEAMASRLLTISNNNSAISEFIEDGIGGVIDDDLEKLAQRIIEITNDSHVMENIVKEGRSGMTKINWRKQGEKELFLLKQIVT
ncbi:glycosyltransferase family 4 protein [Myroides odoratimimus]|uniref:glycosyltransferase family 4 protein n=1 Tax=Myroides odoratimimus TaxID=76832 RepID=UPI0025790ADE|nr:glycosyltransferase family 4 protein [Myroides odoratimimus]MDM1517186.1 glycosyltransferase family 4 protein [Myroides odoratimimus]MDM1536319.1 glycosyltransferase family 4 protein [Myroides odoratimimus]MDM1675891.1 glycosyltransferase family 4 protein [Myroides odoratimimus]